jgi:glyoxylase I family protein
VEGHHDAGEAEAVMSRVEHFAVYAEDPTALKDFYVGALGLRVIVENAGPPPAYFLADENGMAIEVLARPAGETNANQRWICHFAFWVDDFRASRNKLESLGIVFEDETLVENDELKTGFFKDPAGNRCQIVWRRRPLGQ